MSQFANNNQCW